MEEFIGCTGATEETMEEIIPSIMNALSFNGLPEDTTTRKKSANTAASNSDQQRQWQNDNSIEPRSIQSSTGRNSFRRRRREQTELNSVQISRTNDTEEEDSYQDLFPSIIDIFSTTGDADTKKHANIREAKANDSVSSISNSNMDGSSIQIRNADDNIDDTNHSNIPSSIMSVLSMVDESMRSTASQDRNAQEGSSSRIFPSIRNVLSMNDGDADEPENQAYAFTRNVFSLNDVNFNISQTPPTEVSNDIQNQFPSRLPSIIDQTSSNERRSKRRRKSAEQIIVTRAYEVEEHYLESVFYVSISAILGSVFRVYMARIFGVDCETEQLNDFLFPIASNICVTNGGRSEQTGGALFTDLPSNVLGSFFMGLITPHESHQRGNLPWLHKDHPLQRDEVFHASLATGFCGCLTTFASWNTQMVVMLDGTYCELGSQIVTVLFGYSIGLVCATHGFQFGRHCGMWMHNFRHRKSSTEENSSLGNEVEEDELSFSESQMSIHEGVELVDDNNVELKPVPSHLHKVPLFMTAVALFIGFFVGDVRGGNEFYTGMILLWILSPVGSLLRWRLSNLNNKKTKEGVVTISPHWVPWGTLLANVLATVLSACMEGLHDRYFSGANATSSIQNKWVDATVFALKTGVAGSLSTVSTMVKESVMLSEKHPGTARGHYYLSITCISACLLGLMVYSSTIRINV